MKSDDAIGDVPTGSVPVVSASDSRVTITGADLAADVAGELPVVDPATLLPHWTDAPTGQVPIVVAREVAQATDPWAAIPAPAWREGEADWVAHEEQFDASLLAATATPEDAFKSLTTEEEPELILDSTPRPTPQREFRTRRNANADPLAHRAVRKNSRSVSTATLTGILMGAVVLGIFALGRAPVMALITAALGLAAAEAYAGYRSVGAHPATILGLVGIVTLCVSVYDKGIAPIGSLTVLLLMFGFVWYLNAERRVDVLDGLGATLFVYLWIGVLGSFGVLMIAPHTFSAGHGMTYCLGTLLLTVANDSGALFVGRALGKRPLAAQLSPNKTIEGTIGGTVVTFIVGAVVLPLMSPWTLAHGLMFAAALSVVVPIGDLFESMVKRTLGVKDLGHLLPGHGGMLDRIDGLLFALPTAYYLAHVLRLS